NRRARGARRNIRHDPPGDFTQRSESGCSGSLHRFGRCARAYTLPGSAALLRTAYRSRGFRFGDRHVALGGRVGVLPSCPSCGTSGPHRRSSRGVGPEQFWSTSEQASLRWSLTPSVGAEPPTWYGRLPLSRNRTGSRDTHPTVILVADFPDSSNLF